MAGRSAEGGGGGRSAEGGGGGEGSVGEALRAVWVVGSVWRCSQL